MSRSYRKTPITGRTTARSERLAKRMAHRRRRCAERSYVRDVDIREVSDVWTMPKDGHKYWGTDDPRWPELARK